MHTIRLQRILLFIFAVLISGCREEETITTPEVVSIHGTDYPTRTFGAQTWTTKNYAGPGGVAYDASNSKPEYGKYYTLEEVEAITLPAGWRIPTEEDYRILAQTQGIAIPSNTGDTEKIKSLTSTQHWNHAAGTNTSGFNAYPTGYIFGNAEPIDGDIAEFWTQNGVTLSIQEAGTGLTSLRMVFYQSNTRPDYRFTLRFVKS